MVIRYPIVSVRSDLGTRVWDPRSGGGSFLGKSIPDMPLDKFVYFYDSSTPGYLGS